MNGPGKHDVDLDRTDELPVLSEDAVVGYRVREEDFDDDPLSDTGAHDTTVLQQISPDSPLAATGLSPPAVGPTADIQRLERDIASLTERWHDVESLLGANSKALAELQNELSASRQELRASHSEQQSLLAELTSRDSERARLQQRLAAAESAAATTDAEIEALRTHAAGLEAALEAARGEARELAARLDEAQERIAALSESLEAASAARAALETERETLARELQATAAARDAAIANAAPGTVTADSLRSTLGERTEAASAGQPDNEAGSTTLLEKIAGLESYIAGRKDHWLEMEAIVAERETRIGELEQELRYRVAQQEVLERQIETERAIATGYRDKLDELQRRLDAHAEEAEGQADWAATEDAGQSDLASLRGRLHAASRLAENLEGTLQTQEAAEDGGGSPALICLTEDTAPRHDITRDVTTIGRGSDCDVRIQTHFVSRMHAVLLRKGSSIVLEDRGSTNGVFVNSVRVDSATLRDGDWVTIGETQFRFVAGSAAGE